jgi:hypothetical protein
LLNAVARRDMRAWLYEVLERNYEWDEVNCCPIAARADSTRRPHLLATTGISGYKKRFTGLEVMLRRGVELCCAGACCCERMFPRERSLRYPRQRHFDARQSAGLFVYE